MLANKSKSRNDIKKLRRSIVVLNVVIIAISIFLVYQFIILTMADGMTISIIFNMMIIGIGEALCISYLKKVLKTYKELKHS